MSVHEQYEGGENFDLRQILLQGRNLRLHERTALFGSFLGKLESNREMQCLRRLATSTDREVLVGDPHTGLPRRMLMFGSNNYLGLATHPVVKERVKKVIDFYGVGVGGPPLLNGYTVLHHELEERLAALKQTEDALIFSSGYGANVGLAVGLFGQGDTVIADAYSHASFCDGVKLSGARALRFCHNDVGGLAHLLNEVRQRQHGEIFVGVEGVYSMDGDLAPLDALVPLCKQQGAIIVLDDAHGTGVMGPGGHGTASHFGLEGKIDITMGTFSKAFAVTGGFVAASKPIIDYLRFFARPYMFSASLPPMVVATVLACLDTIDREPEIVERLRENVRYAATGLQKLRFAAHPQAAIIPLRVPAWMNIRRAARRLHELGIFVNSVEYPAVPVSQQRFRLSVMATHTHEDIDRLLSAIASVWKEMENDHKETLTDRRSHAA